MAVTTELQIKLRRTGGSGPNAQWTWELQDAEGNVVKKGTSYGDEARAFATARKVRDKLAKD
jgi:hypothetical protein